MTMLYIDPGTGSMLFSLLIGAISLLWFGLWTLWMKVRYIVPGRTRVDGKTLPLVIFSDGGQYWQFFEPVCRELDGRVFDVTYLTADPNDPALFAKIPCLHAEFIGRGNKAYARMNFLKAVIVLSTTPGLDVYQWKRSKFVKHYVHMLHGVEVIGYASFGVTFYDTLLLSAEHQREETRALEATRGDPEKEIVMVGVPYWDEIAKKIRELKSPVVQGTTVLLAPSWREMGLLRRYGGRIIDALLQTGYHIIIRPHPQSFISERYVLDELMERYPSNGQLEWNRDADNFDVMRRSDIMVSDYSGAIFDFAMVHDKPVITTPVDWKDSVYDLQWLGITTWTQKALPCVGAVLTDDVLLNLKVLIDDCLINDRYRAERRRLRDEAWLYRGEGAKIIADYLIRKYRELCGDVEGEAINDAK